MNSDTKQNNPLISVITPVYNGCDTLRRAIVSALNQTHQNFELIIVDDASTEPIDKVVQEFDDERIQYVRHSSNKGVSAGRNTGLNKSKGDFIVFLDSDDEFLPEKLKVQSELFNTLADDTGLMISNLYSSVEKNEVCISRSIVSGYLSSEYPFQAVYSPPSSWMFRRECLEQVGLFDETIFMDDDTDYFIRILEKMAVYYFDQPLGVKYVSDERRGVYPDRYFLGKEIFLKKYFHHMKNDKQYLSKYYGIMAKDYANVNMMPEAKTFYLKAFMANYQFKYLMKYFRCGIKKVVCMDKK